MSDTIAVARHEGVGVEVLVDGLRQVASRYDTYLIDLWGVMHDGVTAFPHAVDCLARLRGSGAQVVFVSNTPRRETDMPAYLSQLGIADDCYDDVVTAGDAARAFVADLVQRAGDVRYALACPDNRTALLHGVPGVSEAADLESANLLLNIGPPASSDRPLTVYDERLERAHRLSLPMLCANPDQNVLVGDRVVQCAGAVAHRYLDAGGAVWFQGKPYAGIYERAMRKLPRPERAVLAIGDAVATDIRGARRMGYDNVLVLDGIELVRTREAAATGAPRASDRALTEHGMRPTYTVDQLRW